MQIGVSTASLYPLHVEDAFRTVAELGIRNAEIFANAGCEAGEPYISELCGIREKFNMNVVSFHPFSSPLESVFLFSNYDRRVDEIMNLYRVFFSAMNRLGAKIFVLHGKLLGKKYEPEQYVRQFLKLSEAADEYGVTIAQENVSYCMSGRLDFLKMLKRELGGKAKFVLDLKQARRSGEDPFEILEALGGSIIHFHLSDANDEKDCLPVGKGCFDFGELIKRLIAAGFDGALVVELYRENYGDFSELRDSELRLREILDKLGG